MNTAYSEKLCYEAPHAMWKSGLLVKPSRENFPLNLAKLMHAHEMMGKTLAERAKMSRPKISRLLSGNCEPSLDDLDKLANVFDIPVSALFFDSTDPRSSGMDIDKAIQVMTDFAKTHK